MQNIEVGDTVQLTASALMGLMKVAGDVYQKIVASGKVGGTVISMSPGIIGIDMSPALDAPLIIETAESTCHLAVQLVKKGSDPAPEGAGIVATARRRVAGQPTTAESPFAVVPFPFPFQQVPQPTAERIPERIKMAQWVISRILEFKQYGIVQDLNRHSDEDAGRRADPAFSKDGYRPVAVDLTASEEKLYNSALANIGSWITAVALELPTHPEFSAELGGSVQVCGTVVRAPVEVERPEMGFTGPVAQMQEDDQS